MADCSGGLAYSEWRRFKKQLKVLPDIFDMEKKLNQYIFVGDLRGDIIIRSEYVLILDIIIIIHPLHHFRYNVHYLGEAGLYGSPLVFTLLLCWMRTFE